MNAITDKDDIGQLVHFAVKQGIGAERYYAVPALALLRKYWAAIDEPFRRTIIGDVEIHLALDHHKKMPERAKWDAAVADLRPAKAAFTVDYHCHKCKARGLKLWRGIHGCPDKNGHELLCAARLAPSMRVDKTGRYQSEHGRSDQVKGWLPAVPTDDT